MLIRRFCWSYREHWPFWCVAGQRSRMIKFLVSQVVITSLVLGTMKKHGIIKYAPNSLLSMRIQLNRIPILQAPVFSLISIPIMGYNMYVTVLSGATKSVSIMQKSNSSTSGPYCSWLSPLWETRHLHPFSSLFLCMWQNFVRTGVELCTWVQVMAPAMLHGDAE